MEKWDLFNEKRQLIHKTHNRQDEMKLGEYHIVVEIWTINSKNEILLTLRHPDKEKYPNFWENTAGSVLSGEGSKTGAVRELYEETGIRASENELQLLGTAKEKTAFVDTYIVRKDYDISELTMQEGETSKAQWVSLDELDRMINLGIIAPPVARRFSLLREKLEEFLFNS